MSPFEAPTRLPFGAAGPQPPSCSGGQYSLNPRQTSFATNATTQSKSGGLFDVGLGQPNGSHLPSTSGNTLFGGAAATSQQPAQTLPQSQPNHCFPTQPGCALFAQPSDPPVRPGGLIGSSIAFAALPSSNPFGLSNRPTQASEPPSRSFGGPFGNPDKTPSASATSARPAQTVLSSSGPTLFNNVYSAAETPPSASSSKPVQATVVAPSTRWSGDSFVPAISKPNALQEYQRQLEKYEERKKEAITG
ncbi:FG-nucleoporin nsp1, partial [Didymella keratinophila]